MAWQKQSIYLLLFFVKMLAQFEFVNINVADEGLKAKAIQHLTQAGVNLSQYNFILNPTNDAWCRDHGPAFVVNRKEKKKAIVDWGYNAWGGNILHMILTM